MENIFDGIQRPLKSIAVNSGDVFIPRGVDVPSLDAKRAWEFHPQQFKVGVVCMITMSQRRRLTTLQWVLVASSTSTGTRAIHPECSHRMIGIFQQCMLHLRVWDGLAW